MAYNSFDLLNIGNNFSNSEYIDFYYNESTNKLYLIPDYEIKSNCNLSIYNISNLTLIWYKDLNLYRTGCICDYKIVKENIPSSNLYIYSRDITHLDYINMNLDWLCNITIQNNYNYYNLSIKIDSDIYFVHETSNLISIINIFDGTLQLYKDLTDDNYKDYNDILIKFSDILYINTKLYLIPFDSSYFISIDIYTETIFYLDLYNEAQQRILRLSDSKYVKGLYVKNKKTIYLIPYKYSVIGSFNIITNEYNYTELYINKKYQEYTNDSYYKPYYNNYIVNGLYAYLIPNNIQNIGILSLTESFESSKFLNSIDINDNLLGRNMFIGGFVYSNVMICIPYMGNQLGKISKFTQEGIRTEANFDTSIIQVDLYYDIDNTQNVLTLENDTIFGDNMFLNGKYINGLMSGIEINLENTGIYSLIFKSLTKYDDISTIYSKDINLNDLFEDVDSITISDIFKNTTDRFKDVKMDIKNNRMYLIPYNLNYIIVFDINLKIIKQINLLYTDRDVGLFNCSIIANNNLYCIPYGNLEPFVKIIYFDLDQIIEIIENNIYINTSVINYVDIPNYNDNNKLFKSVIYKNNFLYLIPYNYTSIVQFDIINHNIISYEDLNTIYGTSNLFNDCILIDNRIYLIPAFSSHIVIYEIDDTNILSLIEEILLSSTNDLEKYSKGIYIPDFNNIYMLPVDIDHLTIFNIATCNIIGNYILTTNNIIDSFTLKINDENNIYIIPLNKKEITILTFETAIKFNESYIMKNHLDNGSAGCCIIDTTLNLYIITSFGNSLFDKYSLSKNYLLNRLPQLMGSKNKSLKKLYNKFSNNYIYDNYDYNFKNIRLGDYYRDGGFKYLEENINDNKYIESECNELINTNLGTNIDNFLPNNSSNKLQLSKLFKAYKNQSGIIETKLDDLYDYQNIIINNNELIFCSDNIIKKIGLTENNIVKLLHITQNLTYSINNLNINIINANCNSIIVSDSEGFNVDYITSINTITVNILIDIPLLFNIILSNFKDIINLTKITLNIEQTLNNGILINADYYSSNIEIVLNIKNTGSIQRNLNNKKYDENIFIINDRQISNNIKISVFEDFKDNEKEINIDSLDEIEIYTFGSYEINMTELISQNMEHKKYTNICVNINISLLKYYNIDLDIGSLKDLYRSVKRIEFNFNIDSDIMFNIINNENLYEFVEIYINDNNNSILNNKIENDNIYTFENTINNIIKPDLRYDSIISLKNPKSMNRIFDTESSSLIQKGDYASRIGWPTLHTFYEKLTISSTIETIPYIKLEDIVSSEYKYLKFVYDEKEGTEYTEYTIDITQKVLCKMIIVGGGGGSSTFGGGGGGAVVETSDLILEGLYTIKVGKGGIGNNNGFNSSLTSINIKDIISLGGGSSSNDGGSGGGGYYNNSVIISQGNAKDITDKFINGSGGTYILNILTSIPKIFTFNTFGNNGGIPDVNSDKTGWGGGGAGSPVNGRDGGNGRISDLTGNNVYYGSGGHGGGEGSTGLNGTPHTGGGAGGGESGSRKGGSGIVVLQLLNCSEYNLGLEIDNKYNGMVSDIILKNNDNFSIQLEKVMTHLESDILNYAKFIGGSFQKYYDKVNNYSNFILELKQTDSNIINEDSFNKIKIINNLLITSNFSNIKYSYIQRFIQNNENLVTTNTIETDSNITKEKIDIIKSIFSDESTLNLFEYNYDSSYNGSNISNIYVYMTDLFKEFDEYNSFYNSMNILLNLENDLDFNFNIDLTSVKEQYKEHSIMITYMLNYMVKNFFQNIDTQAINNEINDRKINTALELYTYFITQKLSNGLEYSNVITLSADYLQDISNIIIYSTDHDDLKDLNELNSLLDKDLERYSAFITNIHPFYEHETDYKNIILYSDIINEIIRLYNDLGLLRISAPDWSYALNFTNFDYHNHDSLMNAFRKNQYNFMTRYENKVTLNIMNLLFQNIFNKYKPNIEKQIIFYNNIIKNYYNVYTDYGADAAGVPINPFGRKQGVVFKITDSSGNEVDTYINSLDDFFTQIIREILSINRILGSFSGIFDLDVVHYEDYIENLLSRSRSLSNIYYVNNADIFKTQYNKTKTLLDTRWKTIIDTHDDGDGTVPVNERTGYTPQKQYEYTVALMHEYVYIRDNLIKNANHIACGYRWFYIYSLSYATTFEDFNDLLVDIEDDRPDDVIKYTDLVYSRYRFDCDIVINRMFHSETLDTSYQKQLLATWYTIRG